MPGLGLDAHQDRRISSLGRLQPGSVLEAVCWKDPIIVVGRLDQHRRIGRPFPNVVIGTVGTQHLEGARFLDIAILFLPSPTDRELVEAKHVMHADGRRSCRVQLGALIQTDTHQEPAIAAPVNHQMVSIRILGVFEILCGRNEVIEDVLLFLLHAGLVPVLAILATATQIRHRVGASQLQPDGGGSGEPRR